MPGRWRHRSNTVLRIRPPTARGCGCRQNNSTATHRTTRDRCKKHKDLHACVCTKKELRFGWQTARHGTSNSALGGEMHRARNSPAARTAGRPGRPNTAARRRRLQIGQERTVSVCSESEDSQTQCLAVRDCVGTVSDWQESQTQSATVNNSESGGECSNGNGNKSATMANRAAARAGARAATITATSRRQ